MKNLDLEINEIHSTLEYIALALDNINFDNFDEVMTGIKANMEKVNSLKVSLKSRYEMSELLKYEDGLNILTKQIHDRVDNIIEEIKFEQNEIQIELTNILNKKKLANYNR